MVFRPPPGKVDDGLSAVLSETASAGLFVITDDIDQLHAVELAVVLELAERLFQSAGTHAAVICFDGDRLSSDAVEIAEEHKISWSGDEADVPWIEQDLADEREQLLGPRGE